MHNTRLLVAKSLCKIQKAGAWSNLVLDNLILENKLDARDSAFASALFYGVLERLITLDACIAAHCNTRIKKLSLPVLMTLRLGIYQMLYMNSVPDSAAVNESVGIAKAMYQQKSVGLVNAVLRSFLRSEKLIPLPQDNLQRMSVEYSCPVPLIELWIKSYGEKTTQLLLAHSLKKPPLTIRVNTIKTTCDTLVAQLASQGVQAESCDLSDCLLLTGAHIGSIANFETFREGLFHVQDKASQLCAFAVDAESGMSVLDACSAPGGKSFTMAQLMQNSGNIIATDLHEHRVKLVENRADELSLSCITPLQADMTLPNQVSGQFDRVLCDVPCSGLGVIARKPEIKYKDLSEFSNLPDLQYKILANTSQYCKVGGVVIYSTCTLNPAENEGVVERFLKVNPKFTPSNLPERLGGMPTRTFLGEDNIDGFFIAALRRDKE